MSIDVEAIKQQLRSLLVEVISLREEAFDRRQHADNDEADDPDDYRDRKRRNRTMIRECGEKLHDLGGTDLMENVLYDLAATFAVDCGDRSTVIGAMDYSWDRIGDWLA